MLDGRSIFSTIVATILMIPISAGIFWVWNRYVYSRSAVKSIAKSKTNPEKTLKPELSSYIEDNIFGITWNWWHSPLDFDSRKLTPYCPECQTRLEMEGARGDIFHSPTVFYCEHCENIIKELPYSPVDLDRKVWKEIERRERTGEWKKSIKQHKE